MRLINEQDVFDIIDDLRGRMTVEGYCAMVERVNALPSAQPERESIKWIPHESIFGGLDERVYTCDKCGYNIGFHVENFCPNCGGKYERYEKKEGER